jgi:hypothetical protein
LALQRKFPRQVVCSDAHPSSRQTRVQHVAAGLSRCACRWRRT